jgi:hypothetical protein
MVRTEPLLADCKRSLEQGSGVGVATGLSFQASEVVQRPRNLRMIGTQRFCLIRQHSLEEWFGIGVATLSEI